MHACAWRLREGWAKNTNKDKVIVSQWLWKAVFLRHALFLFLPQIIGQPRGKLNKYAISTTNEYETPRAYVQLGVHPCSPNVLDCG